MIRNSFPVGLSCLVLLSGLLPGVLMASSGYKCWTNRDGVWECGNIVPPEYAQQGHQVFSEQGVLVNEVDRAKTKAEIAEEQRQETLARERQQLIREQAARDRVLLDTFANEDEIGMARDGKLASIKTELRLTEQSLEKARQRLSKLRSSAADMERGGREVPESMREDIAATERQIRTYTDFIAAKKAEQQSTVTAFEAYLKRYRELQAK